MKVISGGQLGVDQAALRAARAVGIETGGWAPRGWLTEDGAAPWLADYGLEEHPSHGYPARTASNVFDSDATLLLGDPYSSGSKATLRSVACIGRPVLICSRIHEGKSVSVGSETWPVHAPDPHLAWMWLRANDVGVLNVAGSRESRNPGIGKATEKWLVEVFRLWKGE